MSFDKYDDVIDSRDIVERIDELVAVRDELTPEEVAVWDETEEGYELITLAALVKEINACAGDDAEDGVTLIRDSYFESYARELVEEIGDLPKGIPHYIEIDWERTAANIQQDYTSVEFDGVTYWVR